MPICYRPWGKSEDGRINFESLSDQLLEGSIEVIRQSFFLHEPVCQAVDLMHEPRSCNELIDLCLNAAKDGVSIVAIDDASKQVVGVLFNKIQMATTGKTFFQRFSERCRFKSSKALVDFMINIDSRIDLFKHYNANCILELMFLAVLPAYGKRRIAEQLITSTLELCQDLKEGRNVRMAVTVYGKKDLTNDHAVPTVVSSILTSAYSQRIGTKLEFERLLEISYDEYEFNEVKYSERIDQVHSHCVLMAKKL